MGRTIYLGFNGKMTKVAEPLLPENANFVIQWNDHDWSGFRTLAECERQFKELEARPNNGVEAFTVVEK